MPPFLRADAIARGVSAADFRRNVRTGLWVPLRHGCYVERAEFVDAEASPATLLALRTNAARRAVGEDAVASHETCAEILGLPLLGRPRSQLHLTRPVSSDIRVVRRGDLSVWLAALPDAHRSEVLGTPITSVARCVVDLARHLSFRCAVVAGDNALRLGLTCPEDLGDVLDLCRRWPGGTRAAAVVPFLDGRSESVLESVGRVMFRDHALPSPRLQVWLTEQDRVDFYFDEHRTAGEADGLLKYAGRADIQREKARDARLADAGVEVVHFDWAEAWSTPEATCARFRRAFERQARRYRRT